MTVASEQDAKPMQDSTGEARPANAVGDLRSLLRFRPLQLAALVVFLTAVGGFAFYTKFCVIDKDIWWHLKVGDWIVEHLAVPHTGILSRTAASRPWMAYSWGYEVLMSWAYRWFGIPGHRPLRNVADHWPSPAAVYWMLAVFLDDFGWRWRWRRSPAGRSSST